MGRGRGLERHTQQRREGHTQQRRAHTHTWEFSTKCFSPQRAGSLAGQTDRSPWVVAQCCGATRRAWAGVGGSMRESLWKELGILIRAQVFVMNQLPM